MNITQEIDVFLAGKIPRQLIERFDSDIDIPLVHSRCTGLLEMLNAYDPHHSKDVLKLAERVGAYWCRIVQSDVLYNRLAGLEAIEVSQADAKALASKVLNNELGLSDESDRRWVTYAVARWHDGAGKIYYRLAEYTQANDLLENAKQLAQHADLWYCLPDIQSNVVRANFEAQRIAGRPMNHETLIEEFRNLFSEVRDDSVDVAVPNINADLESFVTIPLQNISPQEKEFFRGISSLLHNWSVAYYDQYKKETKNEQNLDRSLELSQKSEAICRQLEDDYRLSQALNHQALIENERRNWNIARKLFEEVTTRKWIRGKRIARQRLAEIDADEGNFDRAFKTIEQLISELREERQRQRGELGYDNHFLYYTVNVVFKKILEAAQEKRVKLVERQLSYYQNLFQEEQLQMIRSVRNVVKISTYKNDFAKIFYPIYQDLIGGQIAPILTSEKTLNQKVELKHLEKAFSFVEEASSRELLDLLQSVQLDEEQEF
ncbi:MAG: hypothetical protein SFY66_11825 [Oculatellaceae cyanobacterium bins.114]|nr:hypothetical protein [Oculatellaceae cyanobacterium bins.114]